MIISNDLLNFLIKKKVNFFTGVPDSVLKNFLEEISKLSKINIFVLKKSLKALISKGIIKKI